MYPRSIVAWNSQQFPCHVALHPEQPSEEMGPEIWILDGCSHTGISHSWDAELAEDE